MESIFFLPPSILSFISDAGIGVNRKPTRALHRYETHGFQTHFRLYCFLRCEQNHPGSECAAPLSVFAARAEEVKRGLAEKYGSSSAQANVTAIVVTSDERDKKWWQSVADQGWYFVDYDKEETVKALGRWCVLRSLLYRLVLRVLD